MVFKKRKKHPEHLYINISDTGDERYGMSFCDGKDDLVAKVFDDETRQRVLFMLRTAYMYIQDELPKSKE